MTNEPEVPATPTRACDPAHTAAPPGANVPEVPATPTAAADPVQVSPAGTYGLMPNVSVRQCIVAARVPITGPATAPGAALTCEIDDHVQSPDCDASMACPNTVQPDGGFPEAHVGASLLVCTSDSTRTSATVVEIPAPVGVVELVAPELPVTAGLETGLSNGLPVVTQSVRTVAMP